jgi:hypothetical protein
MGMTELHKQGRTAQMPRGDKGEGYQTEQFRAIRLNIAEEREVKLGYYVTIHKNTLT